MAEGIGAEGSGEVEGKREEPKTSSVPRKGEILQIIGCFVISDMRAAPGSDRIGGVKQRDAELVAILGSIGSSPSLSFAARAGPVGSGGWWLLRGDPGG